MYTYRMLEPNAVNGRYRIGEFFPNGDFRHAYAGEVKGATMWLTPIETSREERAKVYKMKNVSIFAIEPYKKEREKA